MGNMNQMIKQAQKMQEQIVRVQRGDESFKTFTAEVGGGAVSATVNGKKAAEIAS